MLKEKKSCILSLLASILASIFPALFLYCNNSNEARFTEILPAIAIFSIVGIVLFFFWAFLLRSWCKAGITAILFSVILLNYALVEKAIHIILPNVKYWHIVPVLIFVLCHVAWFIKKKMPEDLSDTIVFVLCMVFAGLSAVNIATSIPGAMNRIQAEKQLSNMSQPPQDIVSSEKMPNIYYFIFDEFAGFPQMEEGYGYNNTKLKKHLSENNFAISYTSHNDSLMSDTIITNLVNLDYVVDNYTTAADKEIVRKKGHLYALLRDNGYVIQGLEAGNFHGLESPLESSAKDANAVTASGEDLFTLCVKQSILYPFMISDATEYMKGITKILDYCKSSEFIPERNTFTFVYLNIPHQPFVFDEHGNTVSSSNWVNWEDDKFYLDQYKFCSNQIIEITSHILKNDPDSIIIVQSDHGARAVDSELYFTKFTYEQMSNHFNCVYYRGQQPLEIEGLSGVNTLRVILNNLIDANFEMLELPEDNYSYK